MSAQFNDNILSHRDSKMTHRIVLPADNTAQSLNKLEMLDRLIYDMLVDESKALPKQMLASVTATAVLKYEKSWKLIQDATKNLIAQQDVWLDEACSYGDKGHPSTIFIEYPPNSGFLVYSDNRGNFKKKKSEAPPAPPASTPTRAAPSRAARETAESQRIANLAAAQEREEKVSVKFYDLDPELRAHKGKDTDRVGGIDHETHNLIGQLYNRLSKKCDRTPSINALVSETVPRNTMYQEAYAERAKQKSIFLASHDEIEMYKKARQKLAQKSNPKQAMEIEGEKAAIDFMNARLYEIAFWLADLKAKVSGDARLEIRDEVANLVRSFVSDPQSIRGGYLNFAFLGAPGTGKTQLAQSLGSVISSLGLLSTTNFYSLTAPDLIGEYLGQTAIKTQKVLLRGLEGVTFIDEAYALAMKGSEYGAEAIAQIVATLDKRKAEMVLMVAGYKRDMEKNFFGVNPGMARRFPYQWELKSYSHEDLMTIFKSYVAREEGKKTLDYYVTESTLAYFDRFLRLFHPYFTNQGGDVDNIFSSVKKMRSTLGRPLNPEDLDKTLELITNRVRPKNELSEEKKEVPRCVRNLPVILASLRDGKSVEIDSLQSCEESDGDERMPNREEVSRNPRKRQRRTLKQGNNDPDDVVFGSDYEASP